ncbi:hypothetical protein M430DRAFT_31999 [Amorphotheca resinae ATCC 22711]|uniref:MADS-box domain-containing protein n=1 Tax=Amorphotheca resinae ATCC 22711 TaxID=857342 RepID=A0A2T3BCM3_AMORE|nr:hypothetical protein M430DRAFT_31999 [Amorphotheca resinae ATCC 22711]PSS27145.1 hypothetical protein M430DRAFT_31999 [Amorphotheca resinae ATCC 22711]
MSATGNKRNKDRASKRQKALMKKAHELGAFPRIDVVVIICKRGRFYTYMSTDQ